jgi:hypothetical protein
MERKQTGIGKVIAQALILLLLCGIVGGEFPELLSLTDNASNDFTVSKTKTVVLRALPNTSRHVRTTDMDFNSPAPALRFTHLSPFEKAELPTSELFILHSILRT